jgi:hypothetical protein
MTRRSGRTPTGSSTSAPAPATTAAGSSSGAHPATSSPPAQPSPASTSRPTSAADRDHRGRPTARSQPESLQTAPYHCILELVQTDPKEKAPISGAFAEPSDGLEPSTPSLPWSFGPERAGEARGSAGTKAPHPVGIQRRSMPRARTRVVALVVPFMFPRKCARSDNRTAACGAGAASADRDARHRRRRTRPPRLWACLLCLPGQATGARGIPARRSNGERAR